MSEALTEAVAAPPVRKGNRWLVTLARPGKGSTGTYTPDVLREFGPQAYPAKTKSYFKHGKPEERDPRDQLGSFPEGTFWNEADQKLQGYLVPQKRWVPVLEEAEEAGDAIEMSMYCLNWEKDASGNIVKMGPHRGNTVDAVAFGGLEGSRVEGRVAFESLIESARAAFDTKPAASGGQEKEDNMEIKEQVDANTAAITKLTTLVESFISAQNASKETEAQAKVDADTIAAAESAAVEAFAGRVALVEAARKELLPSQFDALMESAKAGTDVAPLIESAKKVYAEAQTVLTESLGDGGRVLSSGAAEDWSVAGVNV
jgi:hypothetical protein